MNVNEILVRNRREMSAIADMIEGEVNRMCVTNDPEELHRMCNWVIDNAKRLKKIKESDLNLRNSPDYKDSEIYFY